MTDQRTRYAHARIIPLAQHQCHALTETDILDLQPFRASQLRPPGSRLPAPNLRPGTLSEITDSQNNARPQPSMLPQAGTKRTHAGSSTFSLMSSSHQPHPRIMTDDSLSHSVSTSTRCKTTEDTHGEGRRIPGQTFWRCYSRSKGPEQRSLACFTNRGKFC